MGKEPTEKEQTPESSSEEKTEKSSEIGSFKEAVTKASEELSKKQTSEEEEVKAEEKSTCVECSATEEELEVEEKPSKPKFFIATADGKILKPIVGKARGKEYIPENEDQVQAWMNLGIVQDEERAITNKEREEMGRLLPFMRIVDAAHKEGRLIIKGEKPEGEPEEEEIEEEESTEYVDPKIKELTGKVKELESKLEKTDEERKKEKLDQFESFVEEHKDKMKKDMEGFKEKDYFGAVIHMVDEKPEGTPLNVWDVMAEVDGEGNPKYDLETAMKISHESQVNFVKKFITDHPEAIKDQRDKIIGQHYKEKEEREKAPEGPPGERPAIPKKEKLEIKGLQDGLDKFNKYWKEKEKAGAAH